MQLPYSTIGAGGTSPLPPQVRTYMDTGRLNRPQGNMYDQCLQAERLLFDQLIADGLTQVCCPEGRQPYPMRPWVVMPDSGRRFRPIGSVLAGPNIPGSGDNLVSLLSFTVPLGYDGVIDTVVCGVAPPSGGGSGFVEGSGTLAWRFAANALIPGQQRWLRNLGNVLFSLGSLTSPVPTFGSGLRIYSGDLVAVYVDVFSTAGGVIDPNATILASVSGWFYSR